MSAVFIKLTACKEKTQIVHIGGALCGQYVSIPSKSKYLKWILDIAFISGVQHGAGLYTISVKV